MKRLKLLSAGLSASCAVGVLMAVMVTGNQNTLPRTAVVIPTQNPTAERTARVQKPRKQQIVANESGDGIDQLITSSISKKSDKKRAVSKRGINNIISGSSKKLNPFPGSDKTVTVKSGDTLYSIARRTGVNALKIAKLNAIAKPFVIRPGQILNLTVVR